MLLCEVSPALLGLCVAASLVHGGTAIWDVRAAVDGGREVRPAEQHIHSFLESLPFMAISALLCLHWDLVADPARWTQPVRLRSRRLPGGYLAAVFAGVAGLVVAPTPRRPALRPRQAPPRAGPAARVTMRRASRRRETGSAA